MIDLKTCFTYAYSAGTFADFAYTPTAAALFTNSINLDAAGIRIAGSKPPWLIVRTIAAFATVVTAEISLITDSVLPVLNAATATNVLIFRFTAAQMAANTLLINIPLPHFKYKKWLAMEWKPFTSASAGSLLAYLAAGPEPAIDPPTLTIAAS